MGINLNHLLKILIAILEFGLVKQKRKNMMIKNQVQVKVQAQHLQPHLQQVLGQQLQRQQVEVAKQQHLEQVGLEPHLEEEVRQEDQLVVVVVEVLQEDD